MTMIRKRGARMVVALAATVMAPVVFADVPIVEEAKVLGGLEAQRGDRFGHSLAADADLAAIGALGPSPGVVYLFQREPTAHDSWNQVKEFPAPEGVDGFGYRLAISGDVLAIKAESPWGGVYVFGKDVGAVDNWGFIKDLVTDCPTGACDWGLSLAAGGDLIVVGGYFESPPGFVDIFARDTGGADNWGRAARLISPASGEIDFFGVRLAVSGDTVVVGAPAHGTDVDEGRVYVYQRDAGGPDSWGPVAVLAAPVPTAHELFGRAIAMQDDTLLVGSRYDVYVFQRDVGGIGAWGMVASFANSNPQINVLCGAVALNGDIAVVSAGDGLFRATTRPVYVFRRDEGGLDAWGAIAELSASQGASPDKFGNAIAAAAGAVLVSDFNSWDTRGSVYVYPPVCRTDFNGDLRADVADFGFFASQFGLTGLEPGTGADLDGDGDVDIYDFSIFVTSLGCNSWPSE